MSKPANKAAVFLSAMGATETSAPPPVAAGGAVEAANDQRPKPRAASRNGLKHLGGYFNREDVEKFAVLRARLGLDNSQLIKLAIDDLYRKHEAKRAFGDA